MSVRAGHWLSANTILGTPKNADLNICKTASPLWATGVRCSDSQNGSSKDSGGEQRAAAASGNEGPEGGGRKIGRRGRSRSGGIVGRLLSQSCRLCRQSVRGACEVRW